MIKGANKSTPALFSAHCKLLEATVDHVRQSKCFDDRTDTLTRT